MLVLMNKLGAFLLIFSPVSLLFVKLREAVCVSWDLFGGCFCTTSVAVGILSTFFAMDALGEDDACVKGRCGSHPRDQVHSSDSMTPKGLTVSMLETLFLSVWATFRDKGTSSS